jgi:hypothetical protein
MTIHLASLGSPDATLAVSGRQQLRAHHILKRPPDREAMLPQGNREPLEMSHCALT